MNEMTKTLGFAGMALILFAAACLATWLPDTRGLGSAFEDQGELFFPDFAGALEEDPLAARVLEVVEYNEDTAEISPFQIQLEEGEWTIPSHHGYPADAEEKLVELAAQIAQLKKQAIRSDRASDHEELGVLDPLDDSITTLQGRGTRVTLRDRPGGQALVDLIIGRSVPDREGLRYVREPGRNRVYTAEVDLDLSTRFADWIDTDLLDVTVADVRELTYDTRKINPDRRTIDGAFLYEPSDPIELTKVETDDGSATWRLDGLEPPLEVDRDKVGDVIRAIDGLRIVGVRPLPTSLNAKLRSLVSKGFYPSANGELLSNEGGVSVATDDGLVRTLRFGEIIIASGEELTAGVGEDKAPSAEDEQGTDDAGEEENDGDVQTENRYLYVDVQFDPALLEIEEPDRFPTDVFARPKDDPKRIEAERKNAEKLQEYEEERQRMIAEGEERAAELREEFEKWYYVVPGDDFRKIAISREDFITTPGEEEAEDGQPASPRNPTPNNPFGDVSLPPGLGVPEG